MGSGTPGQVPYYADTGGVLTATSSITILSNGNVGIGTTTPGTSLAVSGSGLFTNILTAFGITTAPSFVATSSTASVFPYASTTALSVSGTTYFPSGIWNAAGNVGIGTATPSNAVLHVYSNTPGVNTNINIQSGPNAGFPLIGLVDSRAGGVAWNIEDGRSTLGSLGFYSGQVGQMMTLTAPGSVGIGTTSPYAKLSITGTAAATTTLAIRPANAQTANILDIYNTSGTLTSVMTAAGNLGLGTTSPQATLGLQGSIGVNASQLYLAANGSVGVGTNSPAAALDITGSTLIGSTLTNPFLYLGGKTSSFPALKRSAALIQSRLADDSNYASFEAGPSIIAYGASSINTYIKLLADSGPQIIMQQSGVGTATLTFNGSLNLNTNFYGSGIVSAATELDAPLMQLTNTGATYIGFTRAGVNNRGAIGYEDGNANFLVHVGTSSLTPTTRVLEVAPSTLYLYGARTDASNYERLSQSYTSNVITFASQAAGTGTARNFNFTGGNVGIGTTTPNNLLSVYQLIDFNNTDFSTKLGYQAGKNIVSGAQQNTFVGYQAGYSSASVSTNAADYNTAVGYQAFVANTSGMRNNASGANALSSNTTGDYNEASGFGALAINSTGYQNTAVGGGAMTWNVSGHDNVAVGFLALTYTLGNTNTGVGSLAGYDITTGSNNIVVGSYPTTGTGVTTGSDNILIGNGVRAGLNQTGSNQLNIGNLIFGTSVGTGSTLSTGNVGIGSTTPWRTLSVVGTVAMNGLTSSATGNALCITTTKDITDAGGASCVPSSIRFKENVETLIDGFALDELNKLRIVSFDYKPGFYSTEDAKGSYGLIAEEVADIDTKLVDYGYDGQPLTLKFEKLTGLAIQAIQELSKKVAALVATVTGHDDRINKLEQEVAALKAELTQGGQGTGPVTITDVPPPPPEEVPTDQEPPAGGEVIPEELPPDDPAPTPDSAPATP